LTAIPPYCYGSIDILAEAIVGVKGIRGSIAHVLEVVDVPNDIRV